MINVSDKSDVFDNFIASMEKFASRRGIKKEANPLAWARVAEALASIGIIRAVDVGTDALRWGRHADAATWATPAHLFTDLYGAGRTARNMTSPQARGLLRTALGLEDAAAVSARIGSSGLDPNNIKAAFAGNANLSEAFQLNMLGRSAHASAPIDQNIIKAALNDVGVAAGRHDDIIKIMMGSADSATEIARLEAAADALRTTMNARDLRIVQLGDEAVAADRAAEVARLAKAAEVTDATIEAERVTAAAAELARARHANEMIGMSDEAEALARVTADAAEAARASGAADVVRLEAEALEAATRATNAADAARAARAAHAGEITALGDEAAALARSRAGIVDELARLKQLGRAEDAAEIARLERRLAGMGGRHGGGWGRRAIGSSVGVFLAKGALVTAIGAGVYIYLWPSIVNWVKGFFAPGAPGSQDQPLWPPRMWAEIGSRYSSCAAMVDDTIDKMSSVEFSDMTHQSEFDRMVSDIIANGDGLDEVIALSSRSPESITGANSESAVAAALSLTGAVNQLDRYIQDNSAALETSAIITDNWSHAVIALDALHDCLEGSGAELEGWLSRMMGQQSHGTGTTGTTRNYDPNRVFSPGFETRTPPVKVEFEEPVVFDGYGVNFVNIPTEIRTAHIRTAGDIRLAGPELALSLDEATGRAIYTSELASLRADARLQGIPDSHLIQYAANRAAHVLLTTGAFRDRSIGNRIIEERGLSSFYDAAVSGGAPSSGFFGGFGGRRKSTREQAAERRLRNQMIAPAVAPGAGEAATQRNPSPSQSPTPVPSQAEGSIGGVFGMNKRINELKKLALVATKEPKKNSTNNVDNECDLSKIADDCTKSYYKDALLGQNSNDKYMKAYYAGLSSLCDEGLEKRKADYKEYFMLHDETGEDLIHDAHPKAIVVSDAIGRGGLVENGLEQKRQSHGVALSTPTGNYRANYAWLQNKSLIKK
jgi:hypothetical protein